MFSRFAGCAVYLECAGCLGCAVDDYECAADEYECGRYDYESRRYDYECGRYDYKCRRYDYECTAEIPNVRPKFSNVPVLPDNIEIPNFRIPWNFSNVLFFQLFLSSWRPGMLEKCNPPSLFAFLEFIPRFPGFRGFRGFPGNGVRSRRSDHPKSRAGVLG